MADVQSIREFQAKLAQLSQATKQSADAAHRRLAERQAAETRAGVPRDTGRLAGTIHVERTSETRMLVVVGDASTDYLGFNEFGTRRQPARPFVRPAAARSEAAHESTMLDEARRRIR